MRVLIPAILVLVFLSGPALADDGILEIDILYTSDIHGHIDRSMATYLNPNFPPPMGGGASIASYLKEVRAKAEEDGRPVLLFDSGDIFQETILGKVTEGRAIVEWMNSVDYTANALGNHDFDFGWQVTKDLVELAEFPMMALNVYEKSTGERVPWMGKPIIKDLDGIRVAILGYCTEGTVNMAFPENIEGLDFRPVYDEIPGDVAWAREEQGADIVLVLMHVGLPWYREREQEFSKMIERKEAGELPHANMNAMEIAHTIPGIDAIFAGHTHTGYDEPWVDPITHTLVFEPYARGSSLGHITLLVDRETKTSLGFKTHASRGALVTVFEEEFWPEPDVSAHISAAVAEAQQGMDENVVGETKVFLSRVSSEAGLLGFVVADAYRDMTGADFAIQNTGGVRNDLPIGPITEKALFEISPFDNQLVVVSMSGTMLHQIMEDKASSRGLSLFISGGAIKFDPNREDGQQIVEFTVGGQPIDPDRIYRVAMTNYLSVGNSGMWRVRDEIPDENKEVAGYSDLSALTEYIRKLGVIDIKNDGRMVRIKPSS